MTDGFLQLEQQTIELEYPALLEDGSDDDLRRGDSVDQDVSLCEVDRLDRDSRAAFHRHRVGSAAVACEDRASTVLPQQLLHRVCGFFVVAHGGKLSKGFRHW